MTMSALAAPDAGKAVHVAPIAISSRAGPGVVAVCVEGPRSCRFRGAGIRRNREKREADLRSARGGALVLLFNQPITLGEQLALRWASRGLLRKRPDLLDWRADLIRAPRHHHRQRGADQQSQVPLHGSVGPAMVGAPASFPQRDDAGVGLRAAPIPPVGLARAGGGEVPRPPAALTSPSSVVVPGTPHVQEHGGCR